MAAPTSDGRFRAPLLVVPGELRFAFDTIEALRLTVSAALPFAPGDARLREALDLARELLATPWLTPLSHAAEALTQRVQEAFTQGGRPPAYLGGVVDRALLERRAYQRRTVLGADRIRATLALPGEAPRPVYLPTEAAASLPMFPAFDARLLVEVHPPQDQAEASPVALKALAIGRVVPRRAVRLSLSASLAARGTASATRPPRGPTAPPSRLGSRPSARRRAWPGPWPPPWGRRARGPARSDGAAARPRP